jgi:rhodanese-related sulfurtransferase
MKFNFKAVFAVVFIGSVSGFLINFIRPDSLPLIAREKTLSYAEDSAILNGSNEISSSDAEAAKEAKTINLTQAKKLYDRDVLFIDARAPEDFEAAHIKDAMNIPFDNFDEYKHLLDFVDKYETIITYCGGTDCDLSILLGNTLFEMGYKQTYIFFGGWNDWIEAGYPVEQGKEK